MNANLAAKVNAVNRANKYANMVEPMIRKPDIPCLQ